MDFEFLNSNPEAQLELMNTMLQLEQLTAASSELPFTASPPSPILPTSFSPPPLITTTTQEQSMAHMFTNTNPELSQGESPFGAQSTEVPASAMREMIFHIAALQPVHIDPEAVRPPKRRNVRISKDPQSVAARLRRERISERIRILQRLVPGGTKMDTASMLDEAIQYVKFLKMQVQSLERAAAAGQGARLSGFGSAGAYPGPSPW